MLSDIVGLFSRWGIESVFLLAPAIGAVVSAVRLSGDLLRPQLPKSSVTPPPFLRDAPFHELTINEKARLVFAERSWGCHVAVSAGGANARSQKVYCAACLEDVSLILGPAAARLLADRHHDLFGAGATPCDEAMERLSADMWRLGAIAWAQRSPFPPSAFEAIDRRSAHRPDEVLLLERAGSRSAQFGPRRN
jgi:hypothetical protein